MLLEANTVTVKEGTHKYGKVENKKEPCGDGLEIEILV